MASMFAHPASIFEVEDVVDDGERFSPEERTISAYSRCSVSDLYQ